MQARILGAHQCQAADRHFTSILVDDHLAVDAGSLATTLTIDEQLRVGDLLLTHQHWDHLKDLGGFGYNLLSARSGGQPGATARVYATGETRDVATRHLLTEGFWMNLFALPSPEDPVLSFHEVGPEADFEVGDYRIRSVSVPHSVPVQGYRITGPEGRSVYYTGDNGAGCARGWVTVRPDVLITECTYSDQYVARAGGTLYGHLSPSLLRRELEEFRAAQGYLPRIFVVHVNPFSEDEIRSELEAVSRDLGTSIEVAHEGLRIEV